MCLRLDEGEAVVVEVMSSPDSNLSRSSNVGTCGAACKEAGRVVPLAVCLLGEDDTDDEADEGRKRAILVRSGTRTAGGVEANPLGVWSGSIVKCAATCFMSVGEASFVGCARSMLLRWRKRLLLCWADVLLRCASAK